MINPLKIISVPSSRVAVHFWTCGPFLECPLSITLQKFTSAIVNGPFPSPGLRSIFVTVAVHFCNRSTLLKYAFIVLKSIRSIAALILFKTWTFKMTRRKTCAHNPPFPSRRRPTAVGRRTSYGRRTSVEGRDCHAPRDIGRLIIPLFLRRQDVIVMCLQVLNIVGTSPDINDQQVQQAVHSW